MVRRKQVGDRGLADRVRKLMDLRGLDQTRLAARSEISVSYLGRILSGEVANPTLDYMLRLARALGVTTSQLAGETRILDQQGLTRASPIVLDADPPRNSVGMMVDNLLERHFGRKPARATAAALILDVAQTVCERLGAANVK